MPTITLDLTASERDAFCAVFKKFVVDDYDLSFPENDPATFAAAMAAFNKIVCALEENRALPPPASSARSHATP